MNQIFEALRPLIRNVVRRPGLVLLVALAVSAVGLYFSTQLRIDTDFSHLVPEDYPSVQALERLRDEVGGESEIDIVIESPSFEANRAFAEALIPRAMSLERAATGLPYLARVEFRRDTEFLEQNALYFATEQELDRLEAYLENQIEQARLEVNPFYFELDEEDEFEEQNDLTDLEESLDEMIPTEFPVSEDSTIMVVRFFPTGAQTDIGFIDDAYNDLGRLIADMNPQSFHAEMEVHLAGRMLRQLIEVQAITRDVIGSFGGGVGTVLLIVMLYFLYKSWRARAGRSLRGRYLLSDLVRMPLAALLIGIPLGMSLTWTFGLTYWTFGLLNLMTSTLVLVLFGLGVDYGIHFFGRYAEERAEGRSVEGAAEETFVRSGPAIAMSAITTSAAMFVLTIADFRGFSEFGFIAGFGILFALVSMLLLLPAILSLFESRGYLKLDPLKTAIDPETLPRSWRYPVARPLVGLSLAAVVLALIFLPRVEFEFQFGELEPTFEAYDEVRAKVAAVYQAGRRNPAYIVVDEPEEVEPVIDAIRARMEEDPEGTTVEAVESLQERYPLREDRQEQRLARLSYIRELLDDTYLREADSDDLDRLRMAAQTREPIPLDDIPEYLRERFSSRTGEIGNFVMIYPAVGLSDGRMSMRFSDEIGTVITAEGRTYHAGSTSLVAADMLRLMLQESPWMLALTATLLLIFMFIMFRGKRWTFLAILPLVVGVLWMLGIMELLETRLNFYNLVVLVAVLGIGNDCGVHMVHRYREEGFGSLGKVMRSTGEHITVGSLTTMVSFAWWLTSYHPGLQSIGELAVIGIGATLLAALVFLPALIQWLEDRDLLPGREVEAPAPQDEEQVEAYTAAEENGAG